MDKLAVLFVMLAAVLAAGNLVDGRAPPPVLPAGPSPPANITSSAQEDKLTDKLKRQTKKTKLAEAGDIALGVLSIVARVVVVWLKMRPARAPAPPHQQHPAIVPAPQQQEEHPAPQQQVVNNSFTISIGNK